MSEPQIGVIIESGLADWQILQQDATGFATLTLHGRWVSDQPGVVEVRVVVPVKEVSSPMIALLARAKALRVFRSVLHPRL